MFTVSSVDGSIRSGASVSMVAGGPPTWISTRQPSLA